MIKGKAFNFPLTFENKEATLERTVFEKCCSIKTSPPHQHEWNNFKRTTRAWRAHLVDGRLLYEAGSVGGQQPVRGHDVDLIGSSFFQDLRCCHKVSDIVYDVILKTEMYIFNVSAYTGPKHLNRWLPYSDVLNNKTTAAVRQKDCLKPLEMLGFFPECSILRASYGLHLYRILPQWWQFSLPRPRLQ